MRFYKIAVAFFVFCVYSFGASFEGAYYGTLPCFTCKGVDTWLELRKVNDKNIFYLAQRFIGKKNVYSVGEFEFKGKNAIYLTDQGKKIYLSTDFAKIGSQKLKKADEFKNTNSIMFVDKENLIVGKTKGKKVVKFVGLTNFYAPTLDGYISKKATYVLHCGKKKYEISRVSYYKEKFAINVFIQQKSENTRGFFDIKQNQLIKNSYSKYCKN